MNVWHSVAGMMEAELISPDPGVTLNAINARKIPLFHVQYLDDLTLRIQFRRQDLSHLKRLTGKRGDELKITGRRGIYWSVKRLRKHPVLLVGLVCFLFLVLYLPNRVLFVQVDGNEQITDRQILEAAEASGIGFWTSCRRIRSEQVKNALLEKIPQLQWAGINTQGCVARISVRERLPAAETEEKSGVCSIVARMDGVVDECTATEGNLLCKPGQAVRTGQVLISGYTDCGIFLRASQAEGEIYALTERRITVISPQETMKFYPTGQVKKKISLLLGKKRINLWKDSGIWDTSCGRMYEEYYITLPGDFVLPVALAVDTYVFRELSEAEVSLEEARLEAFAREYLLSQMVAGEFRGSDLIYTQEDGLSSLTGTVVCREMIGRVQREQIGESYVQNN